VLPAWAASRDGETIHIKAKKKVAFRASKELKTAI
jgi:nucleoid DNA-binding protein